MYRCEDCDAVFETAIMKRHFERSGEELDPPTHHCPYCMSEFFAELEECELCGEMKDTHEVYNGLCSECEEKLVAKFKKVLHRSFSVAELEALKMLSEYDDLFKEV